MTDDRPYIEAAKRVIAKAEAGATEGMIDRPCSACKWRGKYSGGNDYLCLNPLVKLAAAGQPEHHHRDRIHGVQEQRDTRSIYGEVVCGPQGVLWEPKPASGGLFSWLFG